MPEVISLKDAINEITKIENEVRSGSVVVLPVEGSYLYVADAFNKSAVSRLHILRGDSPGVAATVVINNVEILNGIAKNMSGQISRLATNFWPGLLTILLQPNPALAWDLGDSGALGEFAVRIPNSKILEALTKAIGPLVIASAANSGAGAARRIDEVSALIGEINLYVDGGELPKSELSTVIRFRAEALPEFEIVRLGAISLEKLQEIIPNISLANPS